MMREWHIFYFQAFVGEAWSWYAISFSRVSFFRHDFLQFVKSQVLEIHYHLCLEWAKAKSM